MSLSQSETPPLAMRPAFQAGLDWPILLMVTCLLALSLIQIFGPISNLAQMALVVPIAFLSREAVVRGLPRTWLFLTFPLLAICSTYWSDAPDVSLRYSVQLLITVAMGVLVGLATKPRTLVAAIYLATLIVAIGSIISNRWGVSEEGPVLIGWTGSKNQIAAVSQLALASALAVVLDKGQPRPLQLTTPVAALVVTVLLIQARSATGVLTAIGATAAFAALLTLRPLRAQTRLALMVSALLVLAPAAAVPDLIGKGAAWVTGEVFHKDATLTGRTYLWDQADDLIEKRPVVGHGYRAVWLGKSTTSIGLLRWTGLRDARGFHFHQTFREVTVDTGFLGLVVFLASFLTILFASLRGIVREVTIANAFFLSTFLSLAARAFTDLIIGPFMSTTVLLFAIGVHAILQRADEPSAGPVQGPWPDPLAARGASYGK